MLYGFIKFLDAQKQVTNQYQTIIYFGILVRPVKLNGFTIIAECWELMVPTDPHLGNVTMIVNDHIDQV